jgi:5-hydroxyisourate hydrolase-like protein (transthyretin family)
MAALIVVGLMNLAWMAAMSLVITVEKLAPRGLSIARGFGGLFIALGALIVLWPSVFSPAGLTTHAGMAMGNQAAQMPGMGTSGTASHQVYRATAGPYRLALTVGPAERMLTPAQAKQTHASSGEVMLDGLTEVMPVGTMSRQRHLEVHVVDRSLGMPVTNARVGVRIERRGAMAQTVALMRMYGVKEGLKDLHYGDNVNLSSGDYTLQIRVNGHRAMVMAHIR